jgi:hypothetical protein
VAVVVPERKPNKPRIGLAALLLLPGCGGQSPPQARLVVLVRGESNDRS